MNIKKFPLFALIIVLFVGSIFVSGCTNETGENLNGLTTLTVDEELTIPHTECLERNLNDKIIMLESTNCPHCKLAMPKLQELEGELNIEVEYLDVSKSEDREKLSEYKIMPKYTPTVLIGCEVLIGDKTKEEFKDVIENWKNEK